MQKQAPTVEYHPPADQTVEGFVHDASLQMAAKCADDRFLDPENTSITLNTIAKVASLLGKRIEFGLR